VIVIEDPFDRLLDAMPKIAQVVNEFSSEEVQRRAFDALLATLGATVEVPPPDPQGTNGVANGADSSDAADDATGSATTGTAEASAGRSRRSTRKSGGKKSWSPNKSINFFPDGQPSLVDFAAEKKPANIGEQSLVICYYLSGRLEMETFAIPDVLAGFKVCGWKEATDPNNSLRTLASRKTWIDTADMSAIKLHHLGRRYVEHNLPRPTKK
jgi:hypothetical protein